MRASFGYVKRTADEDCVLPDGSVRRYPKGSLVKDETLVGEPAAPRWFWARLAFLRRGRSEGLASIRHFLNNHGVMTGGWDGKTPGYWMNASVDHMLSSRLYRGEVYFGDLPVRLDAHEALVSEEEWQRAQHAPRGRAPQTRPIGIATGLARCAHCRYSLSRRHINGGYSYYCRRNHAAGRCPTGNTVREAILDTYVEQLFLSYLRELDLTAVGSYDDDGGLAAAAEAVAEAEAELSGLKDAASKLIAASGADNYLTMLSAAQARLAQAQAARDERLVRSQTLEPKRLLDLWPQMPTASKRDYVLQAFGAVFLRTAGLDDGKRRPFEERVLVVSRSDVDAMAEAGELPKPGNRHRFELRPIRWPEAPEPLAA